MSKHTAIYVYSSSDSRAQQRTAAHNTGERVPSTWLCLTMLMALRCTTAPERVHSKTCKLFLHGCVVWLSHITGICRGTKSAALLSLHAVHFLCPLENHSIRMPKSASLITYRHIHPPCIEICLVGAAYGRPTGPSDLVKRSKSLGIHAVWLAASCICPIRS